MAAAALVFLLRAMGGTERDVGTSAVIGVLAMVAVVAWIAVLFFVKRIEEAILNPGNRGHYNVCVSNCQHWVYAQVIAARAACP